METIAPAFVSAGDALTVTCIVTGATAATVVNFVPSTGLIDDGGVIIPTIANTVIEATCEAPSLGISDLTPASVQVLPGAPSFTTASASPDTISAGDAFFVQCDVRDAFDNEVTDAGAFTITASPGPVVEVDGGLIITASGSHTISCALDSLDAGSTTVTVSAGLPASLSLERVPDQMIYDAGVVGVNARVFDRFGNLVPTATVTSAVSLVSGVTQPSALDDGGFLLPADGLYRVTAQVDPPTFDDAGVSAFADFPVNGDAPSISCNSPADLAFVFTSSPTILAFGASAQDGNGVASATVNGASASVNNGQLSAGVTTKFGVNSVDVIAVDGDGRQSEKLCTFLAANLWAGEGALIPDTTSLRLGGAAVNQTGPLNSLSDITTAALNSNVVSTDFGTALATHDPLLPKTCDSSFQSACFHYSTVNYVSVTVGARDPQLTAVTDGVSLTTSTFPVVVTVQLTEETLGVPIPPTTATITYSVTDSWILDLRLQSGAYHAYQRANSRTQTAAVQQVSSSGSATAIATLNTLASGTLRDDVLAMPLPDYSLAAIDGLLANARVSAVGSRSVQKLDNTGAITLTTSTGFSSLAVQAGRLLFGGSTLVVAPAAQSRVNFGVPLSSAPVANNSSASTDGVASLHQAYRAQTLTALWRGGWFDASLPAGWLDGFPDFSATLVPLLPPVTYVSGSRLRLELGGVAATLSDPALPPGLSIRFDMAVPIDVVSSPSAGNWNLFASSSSVDALSFEVLSGGPLDGNAWAALQQRLIALVQLIALRASAAVDVSLPVLSFPFPQSFTAYGFTSQQSFGLQPTAPLVMQAPWETFSGNTIIQ